MWYDQTKGLPDPVVSTAMFGIGPEYDAQGVGHEDRAVVLWDEKDGKNPTFESGYLFISPEALRATRLDPLVVPIRGVKVPYTTTACGYIGEPGGYVPPGYPDTYKATPLPNLLLAFKLTPMPVRPPAPPDPGAIRIMPLFKS